jgi:hypothetical protein
MLEDCPHKQIVLVYTSGKKILTGGSEKDLLVCCGDCKKELYRTSVYGKKVINLLPI